MIYRGRKGLSGKKRRLKAPVSKTNGAPQGWDTPQKGPKRGMKEV
jgi:hypothetical protein